MSSKITGMTSISGSPISRFEGEEQTAKSLIRCAVDILLKDSSNRAEAQLLTSLKMHPLTFEKCEHAIQIFEKSPTILVVPDELNVDDTSGAMVTVCERIITMQDEDSGFLAFTSDGFIELKKRNINKVRIATVSQFAWDRLKKYARFLEKQRYYQAEAKPMSTHAVNGIEGRAKSVIKGVANILLKDSSDPRELHALVDMKSDPLTIEKCSTAIQHFLHSPMVLIVPNEINTNKRTDSIITVLERVVSKDGEEMRNLTADNPDKLEAIKKKSGQKARLATVAKIAWDSLIMHRKNLLQDLEEKKRAEENKYLAQGANKLSSPEKVDSLLVSEAHGNAALAQSVIRFTVDILLKGPINGLDRMTLIEMKSLPLNFEKCDAAMKYFINSPKTMVVQNRDNYDEEKNGTVIVREEIYGVDDARLQSFVSPANLKAMQSTSKDSQQIRLAKISRAAWDGLLKHRRGLLEEKAKKKQKNLKN